MTRKFTKLWIGLLALCLFLGLCSCAKKPEKYPPSLYTLFEESIGKFSQQKLVNISGNNSYNSIIKEEFNGDINWDMKQAKLALNDKTYYYFGKTKHIGSDKGVTIFDYSSFNDIVTLLPTTLLNFKYNKNNIKNLTKNGNIYFAEFVGEGAKMSFATSYNFYGGNLNFFVDNQNNIIKSVISTKYVVGKTTYNYTSVTHYKPVSSWWTKSPKVLPSNDSRYAEYALKKLSETNLNTTLHTATSKQNTGAKMENIIRQQSLMAKVGAFTVDNSITLNIEYAQPQIMPGIDTELKQITILFNENFEVSLVTANNSNKYILM